MQQTSSDTKRSTRAGMEDQSRPSHRYLLLQVWCSLLTVTMVIMAAFLTTIKPKSSEEGVFTLRADNPITNPTVNPSKTLSRLVGSSRSHIQLMTSNGSWDTTSEYKNCSLILRNNSIYCTEESLYFIYAQVTFAKKSNQMDKHVKLIRKERAGIKMRVLVEGTFPSTVEGTVWVAKIIRLQKKDIVSLEITHDWLNDHTFWGAYQLF